ncbi:MAG: hypothetical protein Q9183_002523 [Haloplaca sp. 2 TL-2023]
MQDSLNLRRHIEGKPKLASDICNGIIKKADGMFLAAKLHLDSLATQTSVKKVREAIEKLPVKINDLYDDTMGRIDAQNENYRELAMKALRWVTFAYRTLHGNELLEALSTNLGETDLDIEALPLMSQVLDVCAGLLIFDEESDTVRLVHQTTQEYLQSLSVSRFEDAHTLITQDCVTYLGYDIFQSPAGDSKATDDPACYFWPYAMEFWASHALASPQASANTTVVNFLALNPRVCLWRQRFHIKRANMTWCPGIIVAAYFGLFDALARLLSDTDNIVEQCYPDTNFLRQDFVGYRALHMAAEKDQVAIVELLLDHHADINARTSYAELQALACTPLILACMAESVNAAQTLVDRGADTMARDLRGLTPLAMVSWASPISFLERLVHAGAHVTPEVFDGYNSLMERVVRENNIALATWLGDRLKLDHAGKKRCYPHPLENAIRHGSAAMVETLLRYGGLRDSLDRKLWVSGCNGAIHYAINRNNLAILRLLLTSGHDVNLTDYWAATALHRACALGSYLLVGELLKAGGSVHLRSELTLALPHKVPDRPNALTGPERYPFPVGGDRYYVLYPSSDIRGMKAPREREIHTEECIRWEDGITAFDIAVLKNDQKTIQLLKRYDGNITITKYKTVSYNEIRGYRHRR